MKYLRAIEPDDLDLMYIVENDASVSRYSSTSVPLSRYSLKQYIAESNGDLYKDSQVRMAILDPRHGNACGFLDVTDFVPVHRRAQIGIVLLEEAQGRGVATEALKEVATYAAQQGIHQLYAVVANDNEKARALFLRSGYSEISTLPQWLLYDGQYMDAVLYQLILE